jgi:hypothetical protein
MLDFVKKTIGLLPQSLDNLQAAAVDWKAHKLLAIALKFDGQHARTCGFSYIVSEGDKGLVRNGAILAIVSSPESLELCVKEYQQRFNVKDVGKDRQR